MTETWLSVVQEAGEIVGLAWRVKEGTGLDQERMALGPDRARSR